MVEVAGGTYTGYNSIEMDPSKNSATSPVTFVADGEAHFAAEGDVAKRFDVSGDHVSFEGDFTFDYVRVTPKYWADSRGPKDVSFEGTWIHSMQVFGMVDGVNLSGNRFGPNNLFGNTGATKNSQTGSDDILDFYWGGAPFWDPDKVNTNIKVIGNTFNGAYHSWNGSHSDCIQFTLAASTVVAGNTFTNCYDETIMVKGDNGYLEGLTIENNYMDSPKNGTDPYAIQVTGDRPCIDCTIRFNSIPDNDYARLALLSSGSTAEPNTGSRVYGNIDSVMDTGSNCSTSVANSWSWNYNVFMGSSGTCGSHATATNGQVYAHPTQLDPTLASSSAAVDYFQGTGMPVPSSDIDGTARPQGGHPDVGAYELVH